MAQNVTKVFITDKSGKQFWNTTCGTEYHQSEVRNLSRHLDSANRNPSAYKFLDLPTAEIKTEHYTIGE